MADEVIDRAFVEVLPKVDKFADQTEQEVRQALTGAGRGIETSVKKSTDGVKKQVTGVAAHVKKGFGGLGAQIAAAFAGAGAVKFIGDTITAASDLGETTSKVQQIFGSAADDILSFSKTSATALGQTEQAALDANATFGIFAKAAGLQGPALTDFTTKLTTLSSDLASFNNTSPEQAIEAIGAALRGESEPIRSYGVLLDEATLKAEAMAIGILKPVKNMEEIKLAQLRATVAQANYNKAVKENGKDSIEAVRAQASLGAAQKRLEAATSGSIGPLTNQQKILAAQSSIMKQTKLAQGDFARTSGGLANQQRILAAQFDNLKVTIGNALLPVVLKFVSFLNKDLVPGIRSFLGQMKSGTGAGGAFVDVMKAISSQLVSVGVALLAVGKFVYDNRTAFLVLTGAIASVVAVTKLHSAAMAVQAAGGMISFLTQYIKSLKLVQTATKIWTAFQWLLNLAMSANPIGLVVIAIGALVAGIIIAWKNSEKFREIVTGAFNAVKGVVLGAVGAIVDFFKNNWKRLPLLLLGPIGIMIFIFKALPGRIRDSIGNAAGALVQKGKDFIVGLGNGIVDATKSVIRFFRGLAAGVVRWINEGSPAAKMVKAGVDFVVGFAKGIYTTIKHVATFFGKLGASVIRWIGSTAKTLYQTGVNLIGGFISGIGQKLIDAATVFGRLAGRILIWIGNLTRTLWQKGADLIGGMLTGAGRKIIDFATWLGGLARRFLTWIGNLGGTLTQKGSDLIGGFLQGVLNRMRNISSWVNDHIVKPIIDAVKHFFGIHSPSTVFEGLGRFMVEGLFRGLAGADKIKAIQKIFGSMPNALASLVNKGVIGLAGLPQKALDAISGIIGPTQVEIPTSITKNFGSRVEYQGKTLDLSTYQALMGAVRQLGGSFRVFQGSYNTSVSASAGTHRGGGVIDVDSDGTSWGSAVAALRNWGFAAWHRTPAQGPWGHHIHAVQVGNPNLSPEAAAQVRSYLSGGDGLAGYAMGAWKLLTDHLAMVHRGEMVVPAGPASEIRRVVAGSNSRPKSSSGTTTVVNNYYIVEAPHYVGDKNDLVRALDDLKRGGRMP
jgi:hypothetical protein